MRDCRLKWNGEPNILTFGSSAVIKKARNLYFVVVPTTSPVTVQVYLIVDGGRIADTPRVLRLCRGKWSIS